MGSIANISATEFPMPGAIDGSRGRARAAGCPAVRVHTV